MSDFDNQVAINMNEEIVLASFAERAESSNSQVKKLVEEIFAKEISKLRQETKLAIREVLDEPGSSCRSSVSLTGAYRVDIVTLGQELVLPFNPDLPEVNAQKWLERVVELAEANEWSEQERLLIAQARLQGTAKEWYNSIGTPRRWQEFARGLLAAFPRRHDFVEQLVEMTKRHKLEGESLTNYYHRKMELMRKVSLHKGENAVSLLIHGLPEILKIGAWAANCKTPEVLYSRFLSSIDCSKDGQSMKSFRNPGDETSGVSRKRSADVRGIRCYNCQEMGNHLFKDCPKPKVERCINCGKIGHRFKTCPTRPAYGVSSGTHQNGGGRNVKGRVKGPQ